MSAVTGGARLVRRPARAVPACALGSALLALGVTGIWLLGTYAVEGRWPAGVDGVVETVASTPVESVAMQGAAVVVCVIGVLLLLAALWPGRPARVRVLADDIPGETAMHRRDLVRHLRGRAENVDGVHSARATVRRGQVDVVIETVVDDPAPVARAATTAVDAAVAELRPATPTRARVRTRRRR